MINPTKSEMGKVSRQILRAKIEMIKVKSELDSLKDSHCAKTWFTNLRQKHNLTFIQWDFVGFYRAITKELLEKAIIHGQKYVNFSQEEIDIIMQARKSVLIHKDEPWSKKEGDSFDVTVGADDGAEACELVGLYVLSLLVHLTYGKAALFRDDGVMAVRGSPRQAEAKKKEVAAILKSTGIDITIQCNLKVVDFLDLTLDLNTGTYKTFNKPNNTPLYVHKQSNHPPNVTKNIPLAVNQRLSGNSSNQKVFDETITPFQQALKNSGYDHQLKFEDQNSKSKKKRCRKRKQIYFNPPYSAGVKSRVGGQILSLVDSCFTSTNPLRKIFNRHTVKVSYRTTPNMQQVITSHNRKLLTKPVIRKYTCKLNCPVQGKCKVEGLFTRRQ